MQFKTLSNMIQQNQQENGIRTERRVCEIHGFYTAFIGQLMDGTEHASPCPVCKEIDDQRNWLTQSYGSQLVTNRLIEAGVPEDIADITFQNMPRGLRDNHILVSSCKKLVEGKINSLVLLGGNGVGKTTLAIATLADIVERSLAEERQLSLHYTTETKLLRSLKTTFSRKDGPTEQDIIDRMSKLDVLVIDEVGWAKDSEYNLLALQEIIDARHRSKRTIILGNPTENDFKQHLTESSRSKLSMNGLSHEIQDIDHRREMR